MRDEDIITHVFVCIDDIIQTLDLDPHPGPKGRLNLSEVICIACLQSVFKAFSSLKSFYAWFFRNWQHLFPHMVEYSRFTRLLNQNQEFLTVVFQKLANLKSFGLVADGT